MCKGNKLHAVFTKVQGKGQLTVYGIWQFVYLYKYYRLRVLSEHEWRLVTYISALKDTRKWEIKGKGREERSCSQTTHVYETSGIKQISAWSRVYYVHKERISCDLCNLIYL